MKILRLFESVSLLIHAFLQHSFLKNLSYLAISQVIIRVSRIITVVILTRFLMPEDYGAAAVILTINEVISVFSRNGITSKIVQTSQEMVQEVAQTSYWLIWFSCGFLFLFQIAIAFPIGILMQKNEIILPLISMSLIYLVNPFCNVQSAFMQREGKIRKLAFASSLQVIVDNILSAILAILGFGLWAIVLPKILVSPIWLLISRYGHPWRPHGGLTFKHVKDIWDYCRGFLGGEMFSTLQVNIDNILVGLFLSINDLGLYYFAFNAGLGITMGLVNSFTVAVFPHLCAVQEDNTHLKRNYLQAIKTISYVVVPLVVSQTVLAPIYVPLLFGQKWLDAIPILMVICASALPRAFALGASQLLKAIGKTDLDMKWQGLSTIVLVLSLIIGLQFGIMGVAWAVLISQILVSVPFGLLSIYRFIPKETNLVLCQAEEVNS